MMELNQEQYEKIARWLDGSPEALTDAERAAAEEIGDLERQVAGELGVALPEGAVFRLNAKLSDAVVPAPMRRFRRAVMAVLAAAAAVLLAVGLNHVLRPIPNNPALPPGPVARAPTERVVPNWAEVLAESGARSKWDVELDELGREMGEMEAKSLVIASPVDVEMDALESDVNELLMDDTWPRTSGM